MVSADEVAAQLGEVLKLNVKAFARSVQKLQRIHAAARS
jgi:hypothetical protein